MPTAKPLIRITLASALCITTPLGAQTPRPVQLGIAGGVTVMTRANSEHFSPGVNVTGTVNLDVPRLPLDARVDVIYNHMFGPRRDTDREARMVSVGDVRLLGATAALVYRFAESPARNRPFILAGMGVYRSRQEGMLYGWPVSRSSTDPGFSLGIGTLYGGWRRKASLELRMINVLADNRAQAFPLTVGLTF